MSYSVALAGSTERAVVCAQALLDSENFELDWVLTPEPKRIGRDQKLRPNLVNQLATNLEIPALLVEEGLNQEIKLGIKTLEKPDFLLVVDFGYLVPEWLLEWPRQAALNVHPSALPAWRGSSPAQFVLFSGAKTSAVSLIKMTSQLDQGPVYWQQEFVVDPSWTQTEYYQVSFGLMAEKLASLMTQITQSELEPQPQPKNSPTPLARRLTKDDAFIDWQTLVTVRNRVTSSSYPKKIRIKKVGRQPLLQNLVAQTSPKKQPALIEQAVRAFNPWPLVWTKIPTKKGPRRMQILTTQISSQNKLKLKTVKVAGLKKTPWNQVKNLVND